MDSFTRELLQDRLTREKASLENLYDIQAQIETNPYRSVEFDSGDGQIVSRYLTPAEIDQMISTRVATIEHINRRLCRANLKVVRLVR